MYKKQNQSIESKLLNESTATLEHQYGSGIKSSNHIAQQQQKLRMGVKCAKRKNKS